MRFFHAVGLVLALLVPFSVKTQSELTIRITSPASGETLQGLVEIKGTSMVEGFLTSELSFTYASDTTNTWFLIYRTAGPVTDGLLTVWDTTLVTDGDYDLRLRVSMQDGTLMETIVTGLRVRNNIPTGMPIPEPTFQLEPIEAPLSTPPPPTRQPAPTATFLPTPTPLSPNPVSVTNSDIRTSLGRGILVTLLTFLILGILIRQRRS